MAFLRPSGGYTWGMEDVIDSPHSQVFANQMDSLMDGLTEPQQQAVGHLEGPVLVLAGPGSGKTTVVTRRVANLVANGIPPWQILALTFTNKAAGEMRERVAKIVPATTPGFRGLTITTFHSFCARLLRRFAQVAGLSDRFTIYDSGDQRDAIKQALKELALDSKNFTPGSMASHISHAKNQLLTASEYAAQAHDFQTKTVAKVYSAYEKILKKNDAVDFDDLLLITARLLKSNAEVRGELQARYQYVMIDEYQDTNYAQFVIAHALSSSHRNIFVVGDPDQSIYGWRGADIRNILEFEEQYPNSVVIPLGQNFRSTAHIVKSAADLIQNNKRRKKKHLHTELGDGEKPTVVTCADEHHEAMVIVDAFRKRHDEGCGENGIAWKDMAVLYRINSLSRVLEEAFRNANVPYVIARGTAFYERKEIKDALSYLRTVANPNDEVSLRRIINVPTRGIGDTTLEKIELWANTHGLRLFEALVRAGEVGDVSARAVNSIGKFVTMVSAWRNFAAGKKTDLLLGDDGKAALADLVERIVRESGLEGIYKGSKSEEDQERLENLSELINAAAEYSPVPDEDGAGPRELTLQQTLNAYLESVALVSDADAIDPANGAVTLMSLHAAKGLEFTVVALAGLEEGLLPHSRAAMNDNELEEERRLAFVGITRAKRHLLITHAAFRTQRGLRERTIPSQFLGELPRECVEFSNQAGMGEGVYDDGDEVGGGGGGVEWGRSSYDFGGGSSRPRTTSRLGGGGVGGAQAQYPIGCLVRHPKFGLGRIEIVTARPSGSSAQVTFHSVGRKTLILEYAKLERVE